MSSTSKCVQLLSYRAVSLPSTSADEGEKIQDSAREGGERRPKVAIHLLRRSAVRARAHPSAPVCTVHMRLGAASLRRGR